MAVYRKVYEDHHGVKIPKGMRIYHIDGNHNNNDIENLLMVTTEEHATLHGFLGDDGLINWIAVQIHAAKKGGKIVGDVNAILLRGVCGRSKEQIVEDGRKGGIKSYELGVGLFAMTPEEKTQAGIKGAKNSNVVT